MWLIVCPKEHVISPSTFLNLLVGYIVTVTTKYMINLYGKRHEKPVLTSQDWLLTSPSFNRLRLVLRQ